MGTKRRPIPHTTNLICFGDTHGGSQFGLVPPDGIVLDSGGRYMPSPLQQKMWTLWRELWDVWVPEATDGEPFASVHLGDATDGNHHGTTSIVSSNLSDQERIAYAVLKPVADASGRGYWHVRGTPAHTGDAGMHEEQLALRLGARPNAIGQHARFVLWKWVGERLVNCLHHVGTTGSQHAESTAIHKELMEALLEAGRWNRRAPDVVIRAHRHRHVETSIPTANGKAFGVVVPGWQAITPWAYRVAGARQSEPQFGAVLIRWSDKHKELFVREKVWSLDREPPE
jgi:hypothetical protein